jgi:hypothetical protein
MVKTARAIERIETVAVAVGGAVIAAGVVVKTATRGDQASSNV